MTPSGKSRARDLGLPLDGTPGPHNDITDVAGVEVGYSTIISGEGALKQGVGPVRTGVTAILPRGRAKAHVPCAAGSYSLNGNGEMTGLLWIEEAGDLQTPITITNTHSVGVARDATLEWMVKAGIGKAPDWGLPVAAETYDGYLNDIDGFHVKTHHVLSALDGAGTGPIELGSVGGGTGMICYEFKGGSGSASRIVSVKGTPYRVGTFVQANFGRRHELTVCGLRVGRSLTGGEIRRRSSSSVIAVIATDAPLLPHQLKRLARRVPIGLARTGTIGHNSSGDIFLAFSTGNDVDYRRDVAMRRAEYISNDHIDPLFEGVVESVEEAVLDSMIANETMVGVDGRTCIELPRDRLVELVKPVTAARSG
ncbi:MAG TPA: P1 family peptidase [Aestuariivirgaceae bacterium]|nr:P1 family peptidase [Aestuariivirgaceae bacterium]